MLNAGEPKPISGFADYPQWSVKLEMGFSMVDKSKYIHTLIQLHEEKTGEVLTEENALEYFEELITLVEAVYYD